ncbi:hypothetical protein LEN26_016958 [Aphanomyces euteiches]|nr:hypothetical protein LEN26_016958 [Aphanomyces euteiches]KAH9108847.1 hypothetical protein AeMF1_015995 [Aphanomyces euteiches]KAH9195669.1 hypothetical protein AeNC1_002346 [Aphanomyces euteiches]
MRQLLKSKHCIMCKTEMERVICITDESQTFESFQDWGDNIGPTHAYDEASGMYFVKENYKAVQAMRNLTCGARNCPDKSSFPNIKALKQHLNQKHGLAFCDICLEHKHVFLQEQELYTAGGLKKHKTQGNPEEGFNGHPKCDFCQNRFYGNNELHEHLRKNHFECEICLHAYGIENRYYKDYHDMENHFRSEHFLCEEPECLAAKFVVFKNHIEFQAHMTRNHPHVRVSRKIDVHFSIRRADNDGRDAYASEDFSMPMQPSDANVITVADFPALVGSNDTPTYTPWENQSIRMPKREDFPELAPSSAAPSTSAYRNAIAPQPTFAMRAHMAGGDPWEYPEMQQAAEVLGANNPFLRLVKPSKKKKNKNASPSPPPPDVSDSPPPPVVVDEEEEKLAPKSESVVESIQAALGSEAKCIQFREVCKKFRQKEIPAVSFYSLARAMFRPNDLIQLFPKLMSLLPDEGQVNEVMALHNSSKTKASKDTKPKKRQPKSASESPAPTVPTPAPVPSPAPTVPAKQAPTKSPVSAPTAAAVVAAPKRVPSPAPSVNTAQEQWPAPAPAPQPAAAAPKPKTRQAPAPAVSGWSNALKEAGAIPTYTKKGNVNVVLNNKDKEAFNARAKNKQAPNNVVGWSSAASWSEPVSAPIVSHGLTPETSKIQVVSSDTVLGGFQAMTLQAAGKPPSRTRDEFPDLPKAGPPLGMQHVVVEKKNNPLAAWGGDTASSAPAETKPKKNKKGKMSLAEFAMRSG